MARLAIDVLNISDAGKQEIVFIESELDKISNVKKKIDYINSYIEDKEDVHHIRATLIKDNYQDFLTIPESKTDNYSVNEDQYKQFKESAEKACIGAIDNAGGVIPFFKKRYNTDKHTPPELPQLQFLYWLIRKIEEIQHYTSNKYPASIEVLNISDSAKKELNTLLDELPDITDNKSKIEYIKRFIDEKENVHFIRNTLVCDVTFYGNYYLGDDDFFDHDNFDKALKENNIGGDEFIKCSKLGIFQWKWYENNIIDDERDHRRFVEDAKLEESRPYNEKLESIEFQFCRIAKNKCSDTIDREGIIHFFKERYYTSNEHLNKFPHKLFPSFKLQYPLLPSLEILYFLIQLIDDIQARIDNKPHELNNKSSYSTIEEHAELISKLKKNFQFIAGNEKLCLEELNLFKDKETISFADDYIIIEAHEPQEFIIGLTEHWENKEYIPSIKNKNSRIINCYRWRDTNNNIKSFNRGTLDNHRNKNRASALVRIENDLK